MVKFTNEIAKRCARWILLETSPAPLPMLHPVRDDMAAAADEIDRLQKLIPNEPQGAPKTDPLHDSRNPNFGRVGGLRCERCQGDGFINIHENLPDEPCPVCNSGAPSGAERVRRASSAVPRPHGGGQ